MDNTTHLAINTDRNKKLYSIEHKNNKQAGSGPARVEKMNLETKKFGDRSKMGLKIF